MSNTNTDTLVKNFYTCQKMVERFCKSDERTHQECRQYYSPVVTFFYQIFPVIEKDEKKKKIAYQFLARKKNPIAYLCRAFNNHPQKADYETAAQKIVDEVILTMSGKNDREFGNFRISDDLTFYFDYEADEDNKFYCCFFDTKTDKTLVYDLDEGRVHEKLLTEIAMYSYLCKQEWLNE